PETMTRVPDELDPDDIEYDNLALLCERHHMLKHNTAWTVRQLPGGILEWTSPTGRIYIDKPISTIEFAPDPEHEIPHDPIPATTTRVPDELDPDDIEYDNEALQVLCRSYAGCGSRLRVA
ncbi:MAG: hypothetical protein U1C73_12960, partial [Dietzia sp.]|nr:hypothetical protein [Dietzia sp.]